MFNPHSYHLPKIIMPEILETINYNVTLGSVCEDCDEITEVDHNIWSYIINIFNYNKICDLTCDLIRHLAEVADPHLECIKATLEYKLKGNRESKSSHLGEGVRMVFK